MNKQPLKNKPNTDTAALNEKIKKAVVKAEKKASKPPKTKPAATPAHETTTDSLPDGLFFLPLGGCGEIGMNLNVYGYNGKLLLVDCGITFGDDSTPSIDVLMPDPQFLAKHRDKIVGLIATHAHEDHIGAIPYLWPQLQCPVYATAFTASLLKKKVSGSGFANQMPLHILPLSSTTTIDAFSIQLITLTHSIPEPNAVVIRVGGETILHTGDWKIDPTPVIGEPVDSAALRALAKENILAMICDSTNIFEEGSAGSEEDVGKELTKLISKQTGKVAVGCFATNWARVFSVAQAGVAAGRQIVLVGRSMWRIYETAKETGYAANMPVCLMPDEVTHLPDNEILYICTGSQGETRAALTRIAHGNHPYINLKKGDTAIFSSRVIPGNEKAISRMQNTLGHAGVQIITDKHLPIHVSGHPGQEELKQMYDWVKPRSIIPVHGEMRHMQAQAAFGKSCGIPAAVVIENGDIVQWHKGEPHIVKQVYAGRLALNGERLINLNSPILKTMNKVIETGFIVASIALDENFELAAPLQISGLGIAETAEMLELEEDIENFIVEELEEISPQKLAQDDVIFNVTRNCIRKVIRDEVGKKPHILVHVLRV